MNDRTTIALPTPDGVGSSRAHGEAARTGELSATIRRLQLLRFPLALSVLFFHNDRSLVHLAAGVTAPAVELEPWAATVQGFFAHGLGGIRMPAFFCISGFLFFAGCTGTREWLARKLGSRVRGVLVPLLAWNALMLLLLLAMQSWPVSNAWFSGFGPWSRPVAEFGPWQVLDALLGLSSTPILYPLWFLRDLFLMCLVAPLFLALPRWVQATLVAVLAAVWLPGAWPYQVPTIEAGFFFFFAGALAALWRLDPAPLDANSGVVMGVLGTLVLARVIVPASAPNAGPVLLHLTHLAGIAALLVATRFIERAPAMAEALRALAAPSFFMFVAHEPLLTLVRRVMHWQWQPQSSAVALAVYFAGVGVTALLLIAAYRAARRWAPRTLALLTGGRSGRSS